MIESLSKRLDSLYSPLRSELPSLPERCIYRYSVLSEVEDLFCSGVRLCFLQGEGGSGKTTLARQVCDYLAGRYSVSWITVDNNSFAGEKKAWYHSSVGREFSIVFGRLAFPTFSQFGRGGISDFEIRDAFSSYMNKGPSLVVFDMNTVPFTRNDYDFLFTTQGKQRPFPPSWRFLVLVRNTPEHIGEGVIGNVHRLSSRLCLGIYPDNPVIDTRKRHMTSIHCIFHCIMRNYPHTPRLYTRKHLWAYTFCFIDTPSRLSDSMSCCTVLEGG